MKHVQHQYWDNFEWFVIHLRHKNCTLHMCYSYNHGPRTLVKCFITLRNYHINQLVPTVKVNLIIIVLGYITWDRYCGRERDRYTVIISQKLTIVGGNAVRVGTGKNFFGPFANFERFCNSSKPRVLLYVITVKTFQLYEPNTYFILVTLKYHCLKIAAEWN